MFNEVNRNYAYGVLSHVFSYVQQGSFFTIDQSQAWKKTDQSPLLVTMCHLALA